MMNEDEDTTVIDRCTRCQAPTHVTESNDIGQCTACMLATGSSPILPADDDGPWLPPYRGGIPDEEFATETTVTLPYVPLAEDNAAWIAEMRAADASGVPTTERRTRDLGSRCSRLVLTIGVTP